MSVIGICLRGFGATITTDPEVTSLVPSGASLHHPPSDILRHLLVHFTLGTLPEDKDVWPISAMEELDKPDNTVTIYDTSGPLDGRIQGSGEYHEQYGIQVRVRSLSPTVGDTKIRAISGTFDKDIKANVVTIDSISYLVHCVNRKGGVNSLGREVPTSKRNIFTLNAVVNIVQLT